MLKRILAELRTEPAVVMYALNALVAAAVAYGWHLRPGQVAAITTIATAVLAIAAAFATRPVTVSTITGAIATIAAAAGAFGLHLSAHQIGAVVPVISIILSLVLRQAVTPASAVRASAAARSRMS